MVLDVLCFECCSMLANGKRTAYCALVRRPCQLLAEHVACYLQSALSYLTLGHLEILWIIFKICLAFHLVNSMSCGARTISS